MAVAVVAGLQFSATAQTIQPAAQYYGNDTRVAKPPHRLRVHRNGVPSLPPQGIFNQDCDPHDTLVSTCEADDNQAAAIGLTYEIAYNSVVGTASETQALLTYDHTKGISRLMSVWAAGNDGLYGTALLTQSHINGADWPGSCTNGSGSGGAAVNNKEFIQCIYNAVHSYPAFAGWYIQDESNCPWYGIGFCSGSLTYPEQANIPLIAAYIHSIDTTHIITGATIGGDYNMGACTGTCLAQKEQYRLGFVSNADSPYVLPDFYPFGCPNGNASNPCYQAVTDTLYNINAMAAVFDTSGDPDHSLAAYPSEQLGWVGQAFAWNEEGSCTLSTCGFPTVSQMKAERNKAIYAAYNAGHPLWAYFYYAQGDIRNDSSRVSALTTVVQSAVPVLVPLP